MVRMVPTDSHWTSHWKMIRWCLVLDLTAQDTFNVLLHVSIVSLNLNQADSKLRGFLKNQAVSRHRGNSVDESVYIPAFETLHQEKLNYIRYVNFTVFFGNPRLGHIYQFFIPPETNEVATIIHSCSSTINAVRT